MDHRLALLAAHAADHHGVFTRADARNAGVSDAWRSRLVERAVLTRLGANSFRFAGTPSTWHTQLVAGLADLGPEAVIAGRPAGALMLLDGFARRRGRVPRPASTAPSMHRRDRARDRSADEPGGPGDGGRPCRHLGESADHRGCTVRTDQSWSSRTQRTLRSGWGGRRRRICSDSSQRCEGPGLRGARMLDLVLGITGVESKLERDFLHLIRRAGLPEPAAQVVHRHGGRTIARVDFRFGSVIVEVAGHGTHATRRQRQRDAQRHTELTLAGLTVLTFTYEDVHERPDMGSRTGAASAAVGSMSRGTLHRWHPRLTACRSEVPTKRTTR